MYYVLSNWTNVSLLNVIICFFASLDHPIQIQSFWQVDNKQQPCNSQKDQRLSFCFCFLIDAYPSLSHFPPLSRLRCLQCVCHPQSRLVSFAAPLWSPSSFAFDNTDNPTTRSPHSNLRLHTHTAHTFVCASPSHTNALVHTYARCQPSPWQLQSAKALFPLLQRRYDSFPLLPSALLGIWLFLLFPPSFPYSLSRSVFFFISYHTHHSVSLLPGSYSVILIITTVQEDNIYIQFRLFLIRKKVGARLGRVQFKPKYWQVKDTFSFLTDPNLNPHVPVLVSAKVLSHPRNTRWKKKSRIG